MGLACRLTKFFKAVEEKGCSVKIISGYRSAGTQARTCASICGNPNGCSGSCGRPGTSCHQYGLAVDVSGPCIGWMRMAAPQFRLVFPYKGQHIQCAEHNVAYCGHGKWKACDGSLPINPDLSGLPAPSDVSSDYFSAPPGGNPNITDDGVKAPMSQSSPLAPLTNALRNILNPQQQQQTPKATTTAEQTPPSLGIVNSTPFPAGTCATQYRCLQSAIYYRAGTCVDSVYQQCAYGCADTVRCATATSTATTTVSENTPSVTPNPELDRLLENLGQATTTTGPVGTAVTVVSPGSLRALGTEAGVIAPSVPTELPEFTPSVVPENTPQSAPETFTGASAYQEQSAQRRSTWSALLLNMQGALERVLVALQPFRGRYPGTPYYGE